MPELRIEKQQDQGDFLFSFPPNWFHSKLECGAQPEVMEPLAQSKLRVCEWEWAQLSVWEPQELKVQRLEGLVCRQYFALVQAVEAWLRKQLHSEFPLNSSMVH